MGYKTSQLPHGLPQYNNNNNDNIVETVKGAYNVFDDGHDSEQVLSSASKNCFISKLDVLKPVHDELVINAPFYIAMNRVYLIPKYVLCCSVNDCI